VIVADGIHRAGGMDRANAALAEYLCAIGARVHLVSYRIEPELAVHPAVTAHEVRMPAGSPMLGMWILDRAGRRVANELKAREPGVRVVVNGTNCDWVDINWIHYVHHAWRGRSDGAPLWYKVKADAERWMNCRREQRILPHARILLANSERTRNDLLEYLQLDSDRVRTVYLGTDDDWRNLTPGYRAEARAKLGQPEDHPLVIFVGAMGYDLRKGFDTLWRAWQELCAIPQWDARLIVAGAGRRVGTWKQAVVEAGLEGRVQILGFSAKVQELIAAADLLVSPVRYEPYGLNVQEALVCGVPAMVSSTAGVAERYPRELKDLLIDDPEDAHELAMRMLNWRSRSAEIRRCVRPVAEQLQAYSWRSMAEQMVELALGTAGAEVSF
jgi:glycosyltransferase involved in cell wall biosynthesis